MAKSNLVVGLALASMAACTGESVDGGTPLETQGSDRPNILLILADDMGYTDPGYMGSEISTPNIDALAGAGVIMTDFHVTNVCNTTRAQLLTGADHNLSTAGARSFVHLVDDALPISQILQDSGYNTFFSGKWDLGRTPEYYPPTKGFTESFALMIGGASHFSDNTSIMAADPDPGIYVEGVTRLEALPDDFYSSTYYVDRVIHYVEKHRESNRPFFAYLAPTAPHWPLQAPDENIAKYRGYYDSGYEHIRRARYEKLKSLGLNTHDEELPSMLSLFPEWDDLSPFQQKLEARRMQIYAAMLDKFDEEIGRLLDYLDSADELENTFIVFLSDNGAEGASPYDFPGNPEMLEALYDLSFENMGRERSYESVGPGWAQVQTLTRGLWKHFPTEGGTRSAAVVIYPGVIEPGRKSNSFATVRDLTATIIDVAGLPSQTGRYAGQTVLPIDGVSLLPHLSGAAESVHGDEFEAGQFYNGLGGIRKGQWKLTRISAPYGSGEWQLFDLTKDPYEANDLASTHPQKFEEMYAAWIRYIERVGLTENDVSDTGRKRPNSHYELQDLLPGYGQ